MYLRQSHQAFLQNLGWKVVFLRKEAQTTQKFKFRKQMKQERSFQMQNQSHQPNFLVIITKLMLMLNFHCRNSLDDHSIDLAASDLINRISFQAQQDISSLKNIAGETGKKLSSFASTFMTDLQDRIL
uniref:Uncharacterized protein n=1 Tax=Salix viminalis TaxID=40686 RepID=A0A6N2K559_SALVM